ARIPVFTARAARGLLSDDHELCMGFPNLLAPAAQTIFGEADVALVLGAELDVLMGNGAFHPGCTLIRLDQDPNAFAIGRPAELALWAIDAIPARAPSSFHTSSASAMGALGMGLPWAIGMKAARPERPVVAVCGDGSFGFTAMEVETSARHGLPVAAVIGNDGGWGIVRHLQRALHGSGGSTRASSWAWDARKGPE